MLPDTSDTHAAKLCEAEPTAWGPEARDRRAVPRVPLEPLLLLKLQAESSGQEYLCTLQNISPGGLMAELFCGECFGSSAPQVLLIRDCDLALRDILQRSALRLVWAAEGRAGFEFTSVLPLAPLELAERLAMYGLLPWHGWERG